MSIVHRLLGSPVAASVLGSILVFLSITALRSAGGLEWAELAAYYWYIRLRPEHSVPDPRLVLIGITEHDTRTYWPFTDATVARALEMLTQYGARAIGLDMYRDIPLDPGREALDAMLTTNRHIIAVMKLGEGESDGVPPPRVLVGSDQVGYNDVAVDPDGVVRRGLLFLGDQETMGPSFALRLALRYLEAQRITLASDPSNPQYLRLGPTRIRPFEPNDGGYVAADARGYQFLLDFQGAHPPFPSYSLTTLLTGSIEPESIANKIVLMGSVAVSLPDLFKTPYSRGLQIPGIELHAHVVSQLLRFGLNRSSPMAVTSEWEEWVWILLWSAMGGTLGLRVRSA